MNSWKEDLPLWRRVFLLFESPMEEHINPVDSSFKEVKRNLDPAFGYVVFEEPLEPPNRFLLKEVPALISEVDKGIIEQTLYRDKTGEKLYLVVKLDPDEVEDIKQKFFNIRMPKETAYCVYGRRSNSAL
jgi:hypothetical protein